MKPSTVWIIGAILFAALIGNTIVTLLVLAGISLPLAAKVLELGAASNDPNEWKKYQ